MIRYIRFNQTFDVAPLKKEVGLLEAGAWKDHYNRSNYEGSWSTLQLRSINGFLHNNTAMPANILQAGNQFADTALMSLCPAIRAVVDYFQMEKTAVRLMKLEPGALIRPHSDPDLNFEEGEVRIHVPVITNPALFFYLDDERLLMEEGSCWYMNLSLPHYVRNEGTEARIHLVIDGEVNKWCESYFSEPSHARKDMKEIPKKQYSPEEQKQIIAQLRSMNTHTGHRLADEMQAALNAQLT